MSVVSGAMGSQSEDSRNAQKIVTQKFHIETRLSPGLFRLKLDGKSILARSSMDLRPGAEYEASESRFGGQLVLRLSSAQTPAPEAILGRYLAQADIPDTPLSALLLNYHLLLNRRFDPEVFRRIFLTGRWLLEGASGIAKERYNNGGERSNRGAGKGLLPSAASGIFRVLLSLNDKGVMLSETELLHLMRLAGLLSSDIKKHGELDAGSKMKQGSVDEGQSTDDASVDISTDENADAQLLKKFNKTIDPSRVESGWQLLQLDDEQGRRAVINLNVLDSGAPVTCRIAGWTFVWFIGDYDTMYYQAPDEREILENGDSSQKPQKFSFDIARELLNSLQTVTFKTAMELVKLEEFDGFSLFPGGDIVYPVAVPEDENGNV